MSACSSGRCRPPDSQTKLARPLPRQVREALWLESNGVLSHLVRGHLGALTTDGELPPDSTIRRHIREMALTTSLSLSWTREELTDAYGAVVWTGDNRYGLEAGAQYFFGQAVADLSPARLALLIALVRSPRRLDPACHPDRALEARNAFLGRMNAASLMSSSAVAASMSQPLGVSAHCEHSVEE